MNRAERRAAGREKTPEAPSLPKVVIATVHPGEVSTAYMASILRARDYMMLHYGMFVGFLERRARSQNVFKSRNDLVQGFLSSDSDYLLFVDADMGIPADAIQRLLAVAHVDERPIVAGLCFGEMVVGFNEYDYSARIACFPTIYFWNVDDDDQVMRWTPFAEYPRDSVLKIDGTGAACVMVHRGVLEKMQAEFGDHWFTPITLKDSGGPCGEDMSFFLRCRDLGIPVHMDTSVKTSHDKGGVFMNEDLWDRQQASELAL